MNRDNPPLKILIVKLSSLGDILHNLPVFWDLRKVYPFAQIDWVVEESYVELLEPLRKNESFNGLTEIIPICLRRLRKNIFKKKSWKNLFTTIKKLRSTPYDYVIETQGLLKSALVAKIAKKSPDGFVAGLANGTQYSGYEPLAKIFYDHLVEVPIHCHAVDRSRQVVSSTLKHLFIDRIQNPPKFYPLEWVKSLNSSKKHNESKTILCFHSTAKESKRWSNENWIKLGKELSSKGFQLVFPWGNLKEKEISQALAAQIENAIVPESLNLMELFFLIAKVRLTIGVDTGLTHLAAILEKPTVEIYCDSPRWKTEGYWSPLIENLGDKGSPPLFQEVLKKANNLLLSH